MHLSTFPLLSLLPSLPLSFAAPTPLTPHADSNPAYFLLAGDSTTAVQSDNGGGWGDGFLNTTLQNGAEGKNYGHNGATTVSFREKGDWDDVLADVKMKKGEGRSVWVTIQFGHNDQKEKNGISLDQYKANLKTFAQEVADAGGNPILVTPLSRRSFSSGKVKEDLADQRTATLAVAQDNSVLAVDLNQASTDYLNAIGEDNAHRYNLDSDDNTHLNVAGSIVFGNMVSNLMVKSDRGSELGQWTQPEDKIKTAIGNGTFYFPGETLRKRAFEWAKEFFNWVG